LALVPCASSLFTQFLSTTSVSTHEHTICRRPSRNRHRFRGARPRQEAVAADDADGERRHVLRGEGGRGPDGAAGGPELGVRPGARRSSREGRARSRTTCRRWRPTPTTTTTTGTPTPAEPVTSTEPPPRPTPIPVSSRALVLCSPVSKHVRVALITLKLSLQAQGNASSQEGERALSLAAGNSENHFLRT
jgi:hypothetical protein